jgi:hypothetical protein
MLHSVRNRHLIALPFVQPPIVPVIAPVAAYPKRLCLFSSVQLDPQFLPVIGVHTGISLFGFAIYWCLFDSSNSNQVTSLMEAPLLSSHL